MSPAETKNFRATSVMLRPDQIARVENAAERLQGLEPNRNISKSDVVRDVFDRGISQVEAEISERESEDADDLASPAEASIRGP